MTYISRQSVTSKIPNKFKAIRVLALECRRINSRLQQSEESEERKITSLAVEHLLNDEVHFYDAKVRREQEKSEAILAAAEGILEGEDIQIDIASEDE